MKRLLFFAVFFIFTSCSQYKHGFISRSWHDINSKFNALLIAREDIEVAKEYISQNYKENFEDVLPVYQLIDSSQLDTAKLFLVDAVKKASVIAQKHSNSQFLPEAYLLIGDARILKGEYENAIETLKYLNTISDNENIRSAALTQMMLAYIQLNDFQNADRLVNILKERNLSKEFRQVHLSNMAYYYQIKKDYAMTAAFLEEAVKTMKKGEEKARFHYILGQIYSRLNERTLARKNYKQVMKNKPDYEMVFNAKLGLLSSESLANNTEVLFEKMLEDRKNQDLKSKIYYKMGETARLKKDTKEAIKYFTMAAHQEDSDNMSKGFSYKAIGDIYLDDLVDYEKAAIYYDSTIITIPKEFLAKSDISDRAAYLNEFIHYKKVYTFEDSLQKLGNLSPEVLDATLEKIVNEKYDKLKKETKVEEVVKAPVTSGRKWRLYDPKELIKEQNDFVGYWGNRKLEDNWRRSEKSSEIFVFDENEGKMVEKKVVVVDTSVAKMPSLADQDKENLERRKQEELKELKKKVPTTKIQLIASERKKEEAAYRIAKIYKLKFKDDKKANEAFLDFLDEYPKSVYVPEVLYYLSLDQENRTENVYASRLLNEFPNTTYGRQVRKGAVVMTQGREALAQEHYEKAFDLYEKENYQQVAIYLEEGLNEYVGSQIEDKMALLRVYALAKMGTKNEYEISLMDFIRAYPNSDLVPKAKEMLEIIK